MTKTHVSEDWAGALNLDDARDKRVAATALRAARWAVANSSADVDYSVYESTAAHIAVNDCIQVSNVEMQPARVVDVEHVGRHVWVTFADYRRVTYHVDDWHVGVQRLTNSDA